MKKAWYEEKTYSRTALSNYFFPLYLHVLHNTKSL